MKPLLFLLLLVTGRCCCAQNGAEIYLFDLQTRNGDVFLSGGVNITNHKGYDNQPFFHFSKPVIYYSSLNDSGRSDIKYYNYRTKQTANLTNTGEREFSPTLTPGEQYISCIIQRDDGSQDLGKYPVNGGRPLVLINTLKVGYHAWAGKDQLLLFVLVDSNTNNLHFYNLTSKSDTIIANNAGRSLHKIPGQEAMSFIQKNTGKDWLIQRFDLGTREISTITHTLPGQENLAWLENNVMIMSEGAKLFSYHVGVDKEWRPVIIEGDISMLKGFTRLATNPGNTKMAVVVSE